MVGHMVRQPSVAQDIYILKTRGLTKEFRGFRAVCAVDLNVCSGAIHALIGPNGAGKTTCFNLLTKVLAPTQGTIEFDNRDITELAADEIAREGIVRSFQISSIFPGLTVLGNVRMALQRREGTGHRFWVPESTLRYLDEEAMELLAAVGIADYASARSGELPYGRKRALELATTLALKPKLLLLDEPTAGMPPDEVGRITDLIKRVAVGRTVLMVEHNLSVVASLSDRITVMARGSILAEGPYEHVAKDAAVIEAYFGPANAS